MKILFFIPVMILFFSCEKPMHEDSTQAALPSSYMQRGTDSIPFYSNNPYDAIGAVYGEILQAHLDAAATPTSNDSIYAYVNQLVVQHSFFHSLSYQQYSKIELGRLEDYITYGKTLLPGIIQQLNLSTEVKSSHEEFVELLIDKLNEREDYLVIHEYILDYEDRILDDKEIGTTDKQYLLTVSSILRHSTYAKRKRPKKNTDLDWDWLTASVLGTVEGTAQGDANGLTASLKAAIMENPSP